MKIGTILFTYHRSKHTKEVIEGLGKNDVKPEKLYIFQDGIKKGTDYDEWNKVSNLIQSINFCDTEVHISEKNRGLAKSITAGIHYVLQECDAVIVLEDDCVPHKQFMRFMVSALNTYQNEEKVYSVSGYAWGVPLSSQTADAYFSGRSCSYGWGTWKDRWDQYEEDYQILNKIKSDREAEKRLCIWGDNLEPMLVGNVTGQCDSWSVFWSLKIIEKGGYCLSPYKQLIHNIGFDGSGVHNVRRKEEFIEWDDVCQDEFRFPKKVEATHECEEAFCLLFSGKRGMEKMKAYQDVLINWVQTKQLGKQIQLPENFGTDIAVWGRGKIFDCLYSEIKDRISINYILESRPAVNEYAGIEVISIDELPDEIKDIIVIPYFDLAFIKKRVERVRKDIHLVGIDELFQ